MFGIGGWEMLVIGVLALLIFGPKRLPDLARSLGKGLAEFRRASSDLRRSIDLDLDPGKLSAPDPVDEPPAQAGSPAVADDANAPASSAKNAGESGSTPSPDTPSEPETRTAGEAPAALAPKGPPEGAGG